MKFSKLWIAAAMLAGAAIAQAQSLAVPLQPCVVDRPDWPVPAPAQPPGLPLQLGGSCTLATLEANAIGAAAAFWCARPAPLPAALSLYAVRWSALTPAMLADYAQLGLPGDNAERIRAMLAKHQTANVADMCDVWGPAIARINAAMPTASLWRVAPNGTYLDRPSYAVVNGVRAGTSKTRAKVGDPCDLQLKFVEGRSVYAQTSPGFVALCAAAP